MRTLIAGLLALTLAFPALAQQSGGTSQYNHSPSLGTSGNSNMPEDPQAEEPDPAHTKVMMDDKAFPMALSYLYWGANLVTICNLQTGACLQPDNWQPEITEQPENYGEACSAKALLKSITDNGGKLAPTVTGLSPLEVAWGDDLQLEATTQYVVCNPGTSGVTYGVLCFGPTDGPLTSCAPVQEHREARHPYP